MIGISRGTDLRNITLSKQAFIPAFYGVYFQHLAIGIIVERSSGPSAHNSPSALLSTERSSEGEGK